MAFVKQKGIEPVQPKQPQTTNPDDYIDQYLQSQMQAPQRGYQAGDPLNFDTGKAFENVNTKLQGGDVLGAAGAGLGELMNFNKAKDLQKENYQNTSDFAAQQANEATDPYLRQALLEKYQTKKGTEAAQTQAYNDLIKERGRNALDTIKFKGQQELDRDKITADLKKAELDRQMQAYLDKQNRELKYAELPGDELTPEEKLVYAKRAIEKKNVPLKNKHGKLISWIPGMGGKQIDKTALQALVDKETTRLAKQ